MIDGADSALTCTIVGTETSCNSGATTVSLTGGQKINYRIAASADSGLTTVGISMRVFF